jgi:hypothetical protein
MQAVQVENIAEGYSKYTVLQRNNANKTESI